MASRLHLTEKRTQGTKKGAKSAEVPTQGRESGVFLAFSRFPSLITRIEQDLRRRTLYPAELRVHYLTGAIVALQTEVVKSKTVEAQIYPVDVSPMINTSTVKSFKYLFTTVI